MLGSIKSTIESEEYLRVCGNEDEDKDMENGDEAREGLTNYESQRLFVGELAQPRPNHSSPAGTLINIMP